MIMILRKDEQREATVRNCLKAILFIFALTALKADEDEFLIIYL